ncbi:hypothetical protein PV327_010780 [Microctonus hyperodae]|uniref:Alpha-1,3-glucosyltransferase n=1 Tax=Microctonus hyperodae TaxID=165561 RepID=A0AA39F0C2_MICHY|nr:hypothetical protein PV327_010780 [Microctonus hyperodae]
MLHTLDYNNLFEKLKKILRGRLKMEKAIKIGLIIGIALFLRCCITHHSYSGENIPPMYGDYEAQRHWQEITINLPMENWYKNTSDNNLEYWGLDYPPLTAYHSFIIGKIANKINPKFVELYESRGYESNEHKLFMRMSTCLFDNREKKSFFSSLKLFLSVSFTVLLTFTVIWAPFWMKNSTVIFNIIERLFPIKRGIFEDKVANVWCLINVFIKLRYYYSNIELAKICLFTTTLSILPSSIDLLLVNSILSEELKEIHAFSQKTLTPSQWEKQQDQSKQ